MIIDGFPLSRAGADDVFDAGTILQNAIETCEKVSGDERFIAMTGKRKGCFFLVTGLRRRKSVPMRSTPEVLPRKKNAMSALPGRCPLMNSISSWQNRNPLFFV